MINHADKLAGLGTSGSCMTPPTTESESGMTPPTTESESCMTPPTTESDEAREEARARQEFDDWEPTYGESSDEERQDQALSPGEFHMRFGCEANTFTEDSPRPLQPHEAPHPPSLLPVLSGIRQHQSRRLRRRCQEEGSHQEMQALLRQPA